MTADQIKQQFKQKGITITEWAKEHGFRREYVYFVLNGQVKAHYGKGHRIARALGLSVGERGAR